MKIALDYDGTVTEDHMAWSFFVEIMKERLHEIKIVTFRSSNELTSDLEDWARVNDLNIIFTNHQGKHQVCLELGWDPDVWIDDAPALIDHNDKPWSKEKLDEWAKTLPNRVTEEPESTGDSTRAT
jgi:hypothetical protein